ncbi:MAG: hypothetical protein AAF483_29955, partial [Planctomycetota bacterium]
MSSWQTIQKALILAAVLVCLPGCSGCSSNSGPIAGTSISEYKNEAGEIESISFLNSPVTDSDLKRLSDAEALTELLLQECENVSDEGFANVTGAKNISSLSILHTPISDIGLEALAGFTELKEVSIVNTKMTGSGLAFLKDSQVETMMIQGDEQTICRAVEPSSNGAGKV